MAETMGRRWDNQTEKVAVTIEAPRATMFQDFDALLIMAVEQFVRDSA